FRTKLNEKMEARRQEMWQKDPKLRDLGDRLEYAKRQLNAALGTGQQKDADDAKAEIAQLEKTIKQQQDLIPVDAGYADTVADLQKIIDATQQALALNRKTTESAFQKAQQDFAHSMPAMDKLPAAQKNLATDLEKRLADLNAARSKYSELTAGSES